MDTCQHSVTLKGLSKHLGRDFRGTSAMLPSTDIYETGIVSEHERETVLFPPMIYCLNNLKMEMDTLQFPPCYGNSVSRQFMHIER